MRFSGVVTPSPSWFSGWNQISQWTDLKYRESSYAREIRTPQHSSFNCWVYGDRKVHIWISVTLSLLRSPPCFPPGLLDHGNTGSWNQYPALALEINASLRSCKRPQLCSFWVSMFICRRRNRARQKHYLLVRAIHTRREEASLLEGFSALESKRSSSGVTVAFVKAVGRGVAPKQASQGHR